MKDGKKIIGAFEPVEFPEFKILDLVAKVDTGAYTGALHCTKVDVVDTPKGKVLQFSPFDHPEITILKDDYYISHVVSSNGKGEKRYFIKTFVKVRGKKYPITLSLADRSALKWPVIIGRRFLHTNHLLVDVHQGRQYAHAGKGRK